MGTAGNDTFVGDNSVAGAFTVSAGDSIDGRGGEDVFNYFGAAAAVIMPQMKNIETMNLIGATATTALNTRNAEGLVNVNYKDTAFGGANLAGIALAADQTLGFNNVTQTAASTITADFGTSATSASLHVTNGSSIGVTNLDGSNITTLNIMSTGSKANTIAELASTGTEDTVNFSGDQKVTVINALNNSVTKVDASTMTGGGANVAVGTGNVTFTGSAYDDRVTVTAASLNTNDKFDGGEGTDTLQDVGAKSHFKGGWA